MRPLRRVLLPLLALCCLLPLRASEAQVIAGRVFSEESEEPVAGVAITIQEVGGTRYRRTDSDSLGLFLLVAVPGKFMIKATRMGFKPASGGPLPVAAGDTLVVDLFLTPDPIMLDEVTVGGERILPHLDRVEFYARKTQSIGTFVTREEIVRRNPSYPHEVLFGMRGIYLQPGPNGVQVKSTRYGCLVRVYVDGTLVAGETNDLSIDAAVDVANIEAVEVYSGAVGPPARYTGGCATVLIWTRL